MSTQLTNYDEIRHGIHQMRQRLASSLPDGDAVRFQGIIMNAIDANPKLAQCTPDSIFGVAMLMAQLGLEPGPLGLAYMIPRKIKGRMVATFQAGYRGLVQLALRSGEIETIYAHYVCENDDFKIEFGTQEILRHIPAIKSRGNVIGYYSVAKMVNGGTAFDFMNVEEVHRIRDTFAYGGKTGPWKDSPTEMGKKTVTKRLTKYLPVRTDYARALSFEGHTIEVTANDKVQSTDGLEFFDVTDAIPEVAEVPVIEAPKQNEKPDLTLANERAYLRAVIGVFSEAKQADIMAAVKWQYKIESFSEANAENVTQEQLQNVRKFTKYIDQKDEGAKGERVNALVEKWRTATQSEEVKEFNAAVEKVLDNDAQISGFIEAVEGLAGVGNDSFSRDAVLADHTVAIWAADDAKKYCINIMNTWESSQEVAV